ncbi:MAG: long-chain fatty acid--CoA ligase [Candidatus Bathyarchaeota archaeon]|nr:MAG: long-chain fatty acid--CoA ligase [Candidatus Bathyarchaeota archaeon]
MESKPKNWPEEVPYTMEYPKIPIFDMLDESARKHPDATAIIFQDKILTYRELREAAYRFAKALQDMGVEKGDRVALFLPNIPQFVISYYGALRAGAILTTISPLYKEREVEHQLNDSGSETLIVLDILYPEVEGIKDKTKLKHVIVASIKEYLPTVKRVLGSLLGKVPSHKVERGSGIYFFQELLQAHEPNPSEVEVDPKKDLALLQYTGGTTGLPKWAMLTHYNLVSNAYMCNAWLNAQEGEEVQVNVLPLFHIYGMTVTMNNAIATAGSMILIPRFDPLEVLGSIQKYKATIFGGVPTLYAVLISHPKISEYDLSSMKFCISGASPLPPEVQKRFMEITGGVLVEGYGLTEASPVTHANPLDPTLDTVKIVSIGLTWPDTDAKIVHEATGVELPVGMVGELTIKGPQVMKGYWNMPEETANVLKNGWLYTGDYAKKDEDGYFYIVDRKKDLIKYKGYSVYPREVEDVLYEHPAVKIAAVVGKSDEISGEIPKAFVVLKDGAEASEEDLIQFVKDKVAPYKRIREVEFREELPMTLVGKVLKWELRED